MTTIEITSENFGETVSGDGTTWIDFHADWCAPCKRFGPIFEEVSDKYPEITFGKVDTEAQQQLATDSGITSIPTLMGFRDGILVYSQSGALSANQLEEVVQAVNNLDMDGVRSALEQQENAAK